MRKILSRHFSFVVLASLAVICGTSARAQVPVKHTVIIAILDDYPAFSPTAGQGKVQNPVRMRAFAFMKVPGDEQKSAIVLNPAYLNPETLNGMLVTVNNRVNAHRGTQYPDGIIASDVSRPYRPINPRALPALNALLTRLREQPVKRVGTLGTGRSITIEDLAEYVRANELPVPTDKSL